MYPRLIRSVFLSCLVLLAAASPGDPAHAERRVALVIGNAGYTSISPLRNPKSDAELMARTLERVGFTVTRLIDADQKAMKKAMRDFGRALRGSDAIGLFYYAGHGVQVAGENYLIPVNANIQDETEVELEGVNVNAFLQTMQRASSRINIVILDACRNNPYASSFRAASRGLARVSAPRGTYIAYSTAPGDVAQDGPAGNSPYTSALAEAIGDPGLTIEEVFKLARRRVLAATQELQTPWETSSITGEFYFTPPGDVKSALAPRPPSETRTPPPLTEREAFDTAKSVGTAAAWNAFLKRFPTGFHADMARAARAKLEQAAVAPRVAPVQPPPAPAETRGRRTYWNHNGSTMYLVSDGARRRFYYERPRSGMVKAGARKGALLFDGRKVGNRYEGTAYLFSRQCGKLPYKVSGTIENNGLKIIMDGSAPARLQGTSECIIAGTRLDRLVFDYLRTGAR